jgi:hypothetical protein
MQHEVMAARCANLGCSPGKRLTEHIGEVESGTTVSHLGWAGIGRRPAVAIKNLRPVPVRR